MSAMCMWPYTSSKDTNSPTALNLNNRRNPLHADQEKPDIIRSAFKRCKQVNTVPLTRRVNYTLISNSVQEAKSVANPCTSLKCVGVFTLHALSLTPHSLSLSRAAYLAARYRCGIALRPGHKGAWVRILPAGVDTTNTALLDLYLGYSRVVRKVPFL